MPLECIGLDRPTLLTRVVWSVSVIRTTLQQSSCSCGCQMLLCGAPRAGMGYGASLVCCVLCQATTCWYDPLSTGRSICVRRPACVGTGWPTSFVVTFTTLGSCNPNKAPITRMQAVDKERCCCSGDVLDQMQPAVNILLHVYRIRQ
jgi:hypothetical protein